MKSEIGVPSLIEIGVPSLIEIGAILRNRRIHDVTPVLSPETPMFGPAPAPQVEPFVQHATHGAASKNWTIHEHTGAHVDAPYHFDPQGASVDLLPADVLFLRPFKKFDLSSFALQPGQEASLEQVVTVANRDGLTLEAGDVAIVDFGYEKYLPGGSLDLGASWWGLNQPGMSEEACKYFAAARVCAVASDTPACDVAVVDGQMSGGTGHTHHFLPQGILIVEGLIGLCDVPATGLFAALPLKLAGGTASPIRVLLLTD
ncbi:cyclase family protein [Streptomyces chartreusis]|uniref:Cyclase family protein n=1 Tax=Streptomyces chartreusis TaxID=1969 RepID=A0A7I0NSI6_STRCX|nr:cyclase family protein [Streptomyces chartreusis]QKZ16029.1 cyclase family protein [Streptomyces chartreusis]